MDHDIAGRFDVSADASGKGLKRILPADSRMQFVASRTPLTTDPNWRIKRAMIDIRATICCTYFWAYR
jgi:hypothetical protein